MEPFSKGSRAATEKFKDPRLMQLAKGSKEGPSKAPQMDISKGSKEGPSKPPQMMDISNSKVSTEVSSKPPQMDISKGSKEGPSKAPQMDIAKGWMEGPSKPPQMDISNVSTEVSSKPPQMDISKGSKEVPKKGALARALSNCLALQCFGGGFEKSKKEGIPEKTPFAADVVNLVAEIRKIPVGANVEELFLFELILNASVALYPVWGYSLMDKKKYKDADSLEIHIIPDKENKTLSIVDNGVGMSRHDLITRFRSYEYPCRHFDTIKKYLTYEAGADLSHIYKRNRVVLGLGFFSAYMVADKVVVTSRVQGDDPFVWECEANDNGVSTFSVAAAPVDDSFVRGTKVTLHLRPGHDQYLRVDKLQELVNKCEKLIHFQPILVFPNGKKGAGILLNDKKLEPIEKLQQKYEHIRLLFVEYISERTKNIEVVISDRPKEGVFCNLDVSEDPSNPPVLEINPRCHEMEVLSKKVECVRKLKVDGGEMVESSEGEKFQEECGVIVEKLSEAASLHEICESDEQQLREKEEREDIVLVSSDKNDPNINIKEAVSLPQKPKKQKIVSYNRKMKKEAAVKHMIEEEFEWSLSRIRIYDGTNGTSFYDEAVKATGLDYKWRWKPPVFMD